MAVVLYVFHGGDVFDVRVRPGARAKIRVLVENKRLMGLFYLLVQALASLASYIEGENRKHYEPAGLLFKDPRKAGLLHLEIVVLR
ncbi:hypothetical protein HK104_000041 [Borealophlyctis nickersoniae]|nr:hypothetical protein HK104_000041 [Borealophlyctis nickersoniae]